MSDWDAARYHRISAPQFDWGQRVMARLRPAAGERILDLGCGTGRLALEILATIRDGAVVGLDRSGAMMTVARETATGGQAGRLFLVRGDGAALPFRPAFDAVFSAATLHWIHDHDAVFASVFRTLRPGGRLVAQCGGEGNLRGLLARAGDLMASWPYAPHFHEWPEPWYFADAATTARRLEAAGFVEVDTSIEAAPVALPGEAAYAEFVACVCIRHHLDRLPVHLRQPFVAGLTARAALDSPPFVLDYQRLNIGARRASA